MPKQTILSHGAVNLSDELSVQLVQPADEPARVLIIWPPHTSVTTPGKLNEVVAAACRVLASASTELSRRKAGKYR